jgi:hypothetical protein
LPAVLLLVVFPLNMTRTFWHMSMIVKRSDRTAGPAHSLVQRSQKWQFSERNGGNFSRASDLLTKCVHSPEMLDSRQWNLIGMNRIHGCLRLFLGPAQRETKVSEQVMHWTFSSSFAPSNSPLFNHLEISF